jgi:pimeloyl-ACP methyl ester carboxylesterase
MADPRRLAAMALVTTLIVGACGSQQPSPSRASTSTESAPQPSVAALAFRPHFEATPCPDDVTSDVVVPVSCGYLTVLEDRAKPDGRTIQLFVVRLQPPGGTTTPDPVIVLGHLAGQDGYGAMGSGGRTHRETVLFDPRGIGHSKPSLDCPEVAAVGPTLAGLRLGTPARTAMTLGAVRACHDRLVGQGIDLASYGLADNAADIEDLRITLGIASWNLISLGSASRIAFEVARTYPSGIRSMFIDSPSIPVPDFITIGPAALDLSISRLVAACAVQPACERGFPHLDTMIREAVAQLEAKPLTFDVTGTVGAAQLGHPVHVILDGAALVRLIRADLGSDGGAGAAGVPTIIQGVLDGKLTADDPAVIALASDVGDCLGILTNCERPNFGALYSIVCHDVSGQLDQARLEASLEGRAAYAAVFAPGPLLTPCAGWQVAPAAPGPNGPITGGVPTTIIRGAFDPYSTPVSDISKATAGLANVFTLEIPNQSYNALGYDECPVSIRNAWIDAPTVAPAKTSCLGQIPAISLAP